MDFALILDVVVLAILLISCVVAFLRGFVREILTILGLGGASITALVAGPKLAPGIEQWLYKDSAGEEEAQLWGVVPYDIAAMVISYIGLFVVTLIVLSVISHYVAKSVEAIGLGAVDRSLGVIFGLVRAVILIGLLFMPFHLLMDQEDKDEWFKTSHSYEYVTYATELMASLMPESWTQDLSKDDEDGEDDVDPLKDLTGEDENGNTVWMDEEAAEGSQTFDREKLEQRAFDVLIENQDRIQDMIQNGGQGRTPNE